MTRVISREACCHTALCVGSLSPEVQFPYDGTVEGNDDLRGELCENILIQIQPVYDDLFYPGVLPWAGAGCCGSRAQAKQHTETDEHSQADQYLQAELYPPANQYPQVYVYTDAHLYPHRYPYEYTYSDIYTNRPPNADPNGYACGTQPARLLETR